jgi:hypothetical protein
VGIEGWWWTCTIRMEDNITGAWYWKMSYNSGSLNAGHIVEELGFSVRCVKDF